jgi:hypothetical protein
MISEISAQLISTFAQNLRSSIAGDTASAAPPDNEISGLALIAKALGNQLKR